MYIGKKKLAGPQTISGREQRDGGTIREEGPWASTAPQEHRRVAAGRGDLGQGCGKGRWGGDQLPSAHRKAACPPNC